MTDNQWVIMKMWLNNDDGIIYPFDQGYEFVSSQQTIKLDGRTVRSMIDKQWLIPFKTGYRPIIILTLQK